MGRIFTSDFDRFRYGDPFVDLFINFYDRVDELQDVHKAELPTGISLDDTFEFNIVDADAKGIGFNDKYNLPQSIMDEIFEIFKDVFVKKS